MYRTSQQVVELNGYVIIVVENRDNKIKLYGSPADKDNLEVGDEILDVNERKLEDLPRAEVIRYIHEVSAGCHCGFLCILPSICSPSFCLLSLCCLFCLRILCEPLMLDTRAILFRPAR